ncbi:MAG: FadR family transcriptional regulator [Chloroflexi bacterium]|nr:FadR family transcriptional regulator [Chloroflexota bacterium]
MMTTPELSSATMGLEPVAKVTLADRVAIILKRFILTEDLQPGDQLPPERELAAIMGVSHRVIREALGLLVGQELIYKEHGRGAFVKEFDRRRLEAELTLSLSHFPNPADLHQARCAIEIGMMPIVANNATQADLAILQHMVDLFKEKLEHGQSPTAEDLAFHQTLLKATHNETLQNFKYIITESIRLRVYDAPGMLHRQMQEESHIVLAHQAVVDALKARDAAAATMAMYAHLRASLEKSWDGHHQ